MLDADYQEFINCAPNILGDVIHKLSAPLVACKTQEFEGLKIPAGFHWAGDAGVERETQKRGDKKRTFLPQRLDGLPRCGIAACSKLYEI